MEVISGGRALLSIDNTPVGYAAGVSGGQDIDYQPLDVLGNLYTLEQVAVGIRVRFQCNFTRILNDVHSANLKVVNDQKNRGVNYLIRQGMNGLVEDLVDSGNKFITASGLKLQTRNFNVGARALFAEDATFVGLALDFNDA